LDAITSSNNYLGTDRLGRPLTDAENKQLGKLLRQNDFAGASLVALRFAYKLTRSRERSRDLMGRANLRLVRTGWDPNAVLLVKRMCRLVWSEFNNQIRETDVARRAEEVFLREEGIDADPIAAARSHDDPLRQKKEPVRLATSAEELAVRAESEREDDARDAREVGELRGQMGRLRDAFQASKDEVNLIWLEHFMKGKTDPAEIARASGRDVADFYAAKKRRDRAVRKIQGVDADEEKA
jgi:hypothetical protein